MRAELYSREHARIVQRERSMRPEGAETGDGETAVISIMAVADVCRIALHSVPSALHG